MGRKFDRTAYMREYMKNKTAQRKVTFTHEEDEKLGKYLDHIGQGYSEYIRNLIIQDMHKNGWSETIKSPKIKAAIFPVLVFISGSSHF